jgi:hypothetical protein
MHNKELHYKKKPENKGKVFGGRSNTPDASNYFITVSVKTQ